MSHGAGKKSRAIARARVKRFQTLSGLGHDMSDHIDGHQAGPFEKKAEPFEGFVVEQDLWLRATFQAV